MYIESKLSLLAPHQLCNQCLDGIVGLSNLAQTTAIADQVVAALRRHEVGIASNAWVAVHPRENLTQEVHDLIFAAACAKLSEPDWLAAARGDGVGNVVLEVLDVG